MIRFLVFVSVISLACAGLLPSVENRIIGGSLADIKEVPYQVAVLVDYSEIGVFTLKCGGVIIREDVVLTTAHCSDWVNPEIRVRAGSSKLNEGGQFVKVKKIKTHDYFNARYDYDFAVLYLEEPLELDGINVAKVTLPAFNQNFVPGTRGIVSGWGAVVENGDTQTSLSKVSVSVVDHGVCEAFYASYNPITPRMLCAGNYVTGGNGFCRGDDGGGLVVDGTLIGLASFEYGCGKPNYPGVYSNVPVVMDWIERMLAD